MMRLGKWSWFCTFCLATAIVSPAQNFKTLTSFRGGYPQYMSLVQGTDGNLYGTTPGGGADWGTAFKITTAGELTVVCGFGESDCPDGAFPYAGLIQATDGNFYGTAWQGNASGSDTIVGAGTVFEITASGQPITLYGFCSQTNCADGGDPFAPLVQAANGNFYGTTFDGGTQGYGTVFEITSGGALTTLHSFNFPDGAGPTAGLIQAKNGNFYGTTLYGGANGAGTVFELTAEGRPRRLHSFGSAEDGANPYAGLVQAKNGNFYGTTYGGGAHGHGTVFEITASGNLTTLYSFCSQTNCADGAYPYAGVIQASDGSFYGTTAKGGTTGWGTLFAITAEGGLTTLHSFCSQKNCTDGADPAGGLIQASDGKFYGTTAEGGTYENGTVFSLAPGLAPSSDFGGASAPADATVIRPLADRERAARHIFAWRAYGQSAEAPRPANVGGFNCSPAPCVLPPTQASEGGSIVTNPLIVTNPENEKELLLGSLDGNCPPPSGLAFHLSRDGGSTWTRVLCMPVMHKGGVYWPIINPLVGYDRNGVAYVAGGYNASNSSDSFLAVQKSTDGIHWDAPVVALRKAVNSHLLATWLVVDSSAGSPWVNSVYVSGGVEWAAGNQVLVSHSTDGGKTWTQVAVDSVQKYPATDGFTGTAVGKDGTVYVTWLRCPGTGPDRFCSDGNGYIMFSKSSDGGNTWSPARVMTKVEFAFSTLTNTNQVPTYDFPLIAADNSDGPHSGSLYMAMFTWTGTYLRVQVIRSTDGGTTWSDPVPVAPASATHDQIFPAISVSPTGLVGVSWLDRRNDPANLSYQAFAAISSDGGKTFPNTQLTTAFSNPDTNGAGGWMGNYTGNTWAGADFIAAWMDSSNGVDMQEVVGGIRLH